MDVTMTCDTTTISWLAPESCGPIAKTEIECLNNMSEFKNVGNVYGTKTSLSVSNGKFREDPFNLKTNDFIVCRARAFNHNGCNNEYSIENAGVSLEECKAAPVAPVTVLSQQSKCQSSCRSTGCGGGCREAAAMRAPVRIGVRSRSGAT